MKPGMKLAILLISCIAIWSGIFFFACSSSNPKQRARAVAEKSLMACVDCPETVEIKAFSDADSVFGREYITLDERVAIATSMMKISSRVMERTDNMDNIDFDDTELAGLMERQMSAMAALRSLTGMIPEESDKPKSFTGWKVKVEYEAKTVDGKPYHSEYWFIIDRNADCVIKSFEIPLL
ncbi:MAG: hypothetical protein HDR88_12140 [Bacteroides sp.]|nr:hypothetical protein [Bacteroides sp.]